MATFYIQLQDKLLQISGELTAENISKALGYVPADSSTMDKYATKDEVSDLVDMSMVEELSQRVDNITFDSLKDNPFLQDGSGELNIVDESGNIIAKIDADGIHSVDFIAGNHKLTDKIDSSALNGYAKESWVTAEITKAATEGKVDLTGYATEEWVANQKYLTEHQDISHLATKDEIPTKVSDLENDSNYLTEHQDISQLATKDEVHESIADIDFYSIKNNPVLNTEDGKLLFVDESGNIGLQLENDRLYVSDVVAGDHILSNKADIDDIPSLNGYAKLTDIPSLDGYVKTEDVPSLDGLVKEENLPNFDEFAKTEDIPSLDGYAKLEDIPELPEIPSLDGYATEEWVNNKNYATEYDLKTIDYSSINNVPVSEDGTGELNITDENGNIGMKVSSDAVYAKDFVSSSGTLNDALSRIVQLEETITDLLNRIQTLEEANS